MITRRVRLQLLAFAVVTVLVCWYGATGLLGLGSVLRPPYELRMEVANAGGLYSRADVDLLGTRVGSVRELIPGPGTGTTVVLAVDPGVEIPRDVRAVVGSKSAIGEGFVELEPRSSGGPLLADGDVIPLHDTVSPPRLESLLGHLDGLVGSLPADDLSVLLDEGSTALDGIAPSVGQMVDGTQRLSRSGVANLEDTTALIRDARTVLDTQVELAPGTRRWTHELAGLSRRMQELDPTVVSLYGSGIRAGTGVTNLLDDNQELLPVLLDNLVAVTTVASDRVPQLRKALVVFPWVLENSANTARYCDEYDIRTGRPVQSTCHYDDEGKPIYTLHLAQQLDKGGDNPYLPCQRGYAGTERYRPDGVPADGTGPAERPDTEPNLRAHCASSPVDPKAPNVRGAQNVTVPAFRRDTRASGRPVPSRTGRSTSHGSAETALWNPATGLVVTRDANLRLTGATGAAPPTGPAGLAWLLTVPLGSPGSAR